MCPPRLHGNCRQGQASGPRTPPLFRMQWGSCRAQQKQRGSCLQTPAETLIWAKTTQILPLKKKYVPVLHWTWVQQMGQEPPCAGQQGRNWDAPRGPPGTQLPHPPARGNVQDALHTPNITRAIPCHPLHISFCSPINKRLAISLRQIPYFPQTCGAASMILECVTLTFCFR